MFFFEFGDMCVMLISCFPYFHCNIIIFLGDVIEFYIQVTILFIKTG